VLPSASVTRDPLPDTATIGRPPTWAKARIGELAPSGTTARPRVKSSLDLRLFFMFTPVW
jgi:hypothetical protein